MLSLGIIGWIVIGSLAGWASGRIMKVSHSGFLANMIIGVIGGILGGLILSFLGFDVSGGRICFSFITCLLGAVIFLTIVKFLDNRKKIE